MNGCDTFAYVDGSLSQPRTRPSTPTTPPARKYMDIINNAMPAFFALDGRALRWRCSAACSRTTRRRPTSRSSRNVDSSQVVIVTGEQDNTFTPGGGGQPQPWAGLNDHGAVATSATKKWTTPMLAAGTYQFDMTGTGDADLYVRIGGAPTTTAYDCRPYKTGSNESCKVTLAQPTTIDVMVRGYASSTSSFTIAGAKQ